MRIDTGNTRRNRNVAASVAAAVLGRRELRPPGRRRRHEHTSRIRDDGGITIADANVGDPDRRAVIDASPGR
jgi:hypothetical protein